MEGREIGEIYGQRKECVSGEYLLEGTIKSRHLKALEAVRH